MSSRRVRHIAPRSRPDSEPPRLPDGIFKVPEGWEEVPVFRRRDAHYRLEMTREVLQERFHEALRLNAEIPQRVAWWNRKVLLMDIRRTTARERWAEAAVEARELLAQMRESKLFTSPEVLQIIAAVAILEDDAAGPHDKGRAVKVIGDLFGVFLTRRTESNLKEREKQEVESGAMKKEREKQELLENSSTGALLELIKRDDGTANVG